MGHRSPLVFCVFCFFCGRGAGIGVSILSESAFNTGTGNMTLNPGRWHTTPQPLFEQRPTISAFVGGKIKQQKLGTAEGVEQGVVSAEL